MKVTLAFAFVIRMLSVAARRPSTCGVKAKPGLNQGSLKLQFSVVLGFATTFFSCLFLIVQLNDER